MATHGACRRRCHQAPRCPRTPRGATGRGPLVGATAGCKEFAGTGNNHIVRTLAAFNLLWLLQALISGSLRFHWVSSSTVIGRDRYNLGQRISWPRRVLLMHYVVNQALRWFLKVRIKWVKPDRNHRPLCRRGLKHRAAEMLDNRAVAIHVVQRRSIRQLPVQQCSYPFSRSHVDPTSLCHGSGHIQS